MATGDFQDSANWRLTTPGGTPYRWKSLEGSFELSGANMSIEVLIKASDMLTFATEMLPPPAIFGNVVIPQYTTFGKTNLRVARVGFKSLDDGSPIDPFNFDPNAPQDTYYPVIVATVAFAPPNITGNDPTDPGSFLEVRGSASGEFLHAGSQSATWQSLDSKGNPDDNPFKVKNRSENVPATVLVPHTSWDVSWRMIPLAFFRNIIKPRLDSAMGKVNSVPWGVLYNGPAKTLLFAGYSFDYSITWQNSFVNQPMVSLDLKFLEKNILWKNVMLNDDGTPKLDNNGNIQYDSPIVRGHNDFWRPGVGWSRMLINGREVYDTTDFSQVFSLS